jgi:hypothetical protein
MLWRQLCCAVLASLIAMTLFAAILRGLAAPLWGVQGGSMVMQVTMQPAAVADQAVQAAQPLSLAEAVAVPQTARADLANYLSASRLTERPLVLQDIDPMLLDAHDENKQQIVLRLLINEYGDVDQVLVEDAALPAAVLWELQQRFLQARFLPGRLLDRAVPSALRIAVTLHSQ